MIIKIAILLFVVFVLYRTFLRFQHKDITGRELAVWVILWLMVGGATIYPQQTDVLAQAVGVERGADLLVYISIIVLFFVVFKVIVKLEKIDRDITAVVRHTAIKENKDE